MRRLMPMLWSVISLASLNACASAGGSKPADLGPTTVTSTQTIGQGAGLGVSSVSIRNDAIAEKTVIEMPIDKAWVSLMAAYGALGIKLTTQNEGQHKIGNESFRARRKVGDVQLAKALNCGGDSSSPNAETYDITLSIMSQLAPNPGGGVVLQTFVQGVGKNALTNSSNQVPCYSMGGFEQRIADLVSQSATTPIKKGSGN